MPIQVPLATYTSVQYNYEYGHLDMTTDFSLSYILIYVTHNFFATLNQNGRDVDPADDGRDGNECGWSGRRLVIC
jgi:hypothetical protein